VYNVDKNEIRDAFMADIGRMSNDVVHHRWVATSKSTGGGQYGWRRKVKDRCVVRCSTSRASFATTEIGVSSASRSASR
jgi:hypothetical protein